MSIYQPNIPTGSVNLDQDYKNILGNFQQLDTTFFVDHTLFSDNTAQNGYHRSIHQIPISTTATNPPNNQPVVAPTTTPNYGQIFQAQINDSIGIDNALYFLSGGGLLSQLTRNFQPTIASPGATFLPGGLIIQWGSITTSSNQADITVSFTGGGGVGILNFPATNFGVWTTITNSSNTPNAIYIPAISTMGFTYHNTSSSNKTFYWIALGN